MSTATYTLVVGYVLDSFTPMPDLTVQYDSQVITSGVALKLVEAAKKPYVKITTPNPNSNNLYTLVC